MPLPTVEKSGQSLSFRIHSLSPPLGPKEKKKAQTKKSDSNVISKIGELQTESLSAKRTNQFRSGKNSDTDNNEASKKEVVVQFIDTDDFIVENDNHRELTPPDSPSNIIKRQMAEEKKASQLSRMEGTEEKMRWEPTYRELGAWKDRHPSEMSSEIPETNNTRGNSEAGETQRGSVVAKYSPNFGKKKKGPTIKTITDARLLKEKRRREKLEAAFHDRIDKTILKAIYTEDKKTVKQICAQEKYQIKLNELNPFVDVAIANHKVQVQREQYAKEMKVYEQKEKEFKLLYKEIYEDTSSSEEGEPAFL